MHEWTGDRVVGTTQESNIWRSGGTWTLTAQPRDGGSHVRVDLDRHFTGRGWIFCPMVVLFGRRMFERNLEKTLNVLRSDGSQSR